MKLLRKPWTLHGKILWWPRPQPSRWCLEDPERLPSSPGGGHQDPGGPPLRAQEYLDLGEDANFQNELVSLPDIAETLRGEGSGDGA